MINSLDFSRFDVFLVNLDPTIGYEIKKTRPALIISPDEINRHISTVIIAPMTTRSKDYPTRIPCNFHDVQGWIVIDQLRTVDKTRLIKKLGVIDEPVQQEVLDSLSALFAE